MKISINSNKKFISNEIHHTYSKQIIIVIRKKAIKRVFRLKIWGTHSN